MDALVVYRLDCEILGGMPFLTYNHIKLDFPSQLFNFFNGSSLPFNQSPMQGHKPNTTTVRAIRSCVVFPRDYIELPADEILNGQLAAIEPCDAARGAWPPPTVTPVVDGYVRLLNDSRNPVQVRKNQHVARIFSTNIIDSPRGPGACSFSPLIPNVTKLSRNKPDYDSTAISIDPDNLFSSAQRRKSCQLHASYDSVFDRYNDASGRLRAKINMDAVKPPPMKCSLPQYERKNLVLLQNKMDELERQGVLAKPEDHGV